MRLSFVLELLLVFLFLAFAAAGVIDKQDVRTSRAKKTKKTQVSKQGPPNRYCECSVNMCNCCRDFSLPVVPLRGPGCASIQYLKDDNMLVSMSFGDRVLTNTTVNSRKPKPICMGLPGGFSKFCGRIYGISRSGDDFKACLGLELRALDDIEAALRVSCFKFGPKGVKLEAAPPVPTDEKEKEDDDDDDDDDYGFDEDDSDEDDDDDTFGLADDYDDDDTAAANQDNEVDGDDADYAGFSLGEDLLSGLFGDDDDGEKKKRKKIKTAQVVTTTKKPILANKPAIQKKPSATKRPAVNKNTKKPLKDSQARPSEIVTVKVPANSSATTTAAPATTAAATTNEAVKITENPTAQNSSSAPILTEKPNMSDPSIPPVDVAKVEAVAAIAQQDVVGPLMVSTSTVKPSTTPTVAELLKNANPVEEDDEDDLLDGMLGEVASIVSDDDAPKQKQKKETEKNKKETDKNKKDSTKKGDLPSSSVHAKPAKKPSADEDPLSFVSSLVGGDDNDSEEYDEDSNETDSNESESKPTKDTNKDDDNDDDDDPINLFDSVIGQLGVGTKPKKTKPTKPVKGTTDDDDDFDDDLLGVLDDDDDENEKDNDESEEDEASEEDENDNDEDSDSDEKSDEVTTPSSTSAVPSAKPEANLVDSSEVASAEIEEVTDYESDEEKTTSAPSVAASEEAKEEDKEGEEDSEESAESNEKSAVANNGGDSQSTDLEIEGDIGLGADDEERQIKRIQQIVGESKRGGAPANWSIFLRPLRRFSPEPQAGTARGDRSRVHRRMNLERIPTYS